MALYCIFPISGLKQWPTINYDDCIRNQIYWVWPSCLITLSLKSLGCDYWGLNNCPTERVGRLLSLRKSAIETKTFISQNVFPWFMMLSSSAQTTGPWHLQFESHSQTVTLSRVISSLEKVLIFVVTPYYGHDWIYCCFNVNSQNKILDIVEQPGCPCCSRESTWEIKVQLKR